MLAQHLGKAIKARRIEKGLSQAELARLAAISRTTLSQLEQGKATRTRTDVLDRILAALGSAARIALDAAAPDPERVLARMHHQARLQRQRDRHLRLAVELAAEPRSAKGKIARAKAVVALWHRNQTCSPLYIDRWSELLALPPARLAREMTKLGDWENAIYQNTPWAWAWN